MNLYLIRTKYPLEPEKYTKRCFYFLFLAQYCLDKYIIYQFADFFIVQVSLTRNIDQDFTRRMEHWKQFQYYIIDEEIEIETFGQTYRVIEVE